MSLTNFSPADAQRQQEEVRLRAAAHREAETKKLFKSYVDSANRIAEADEAMAVLMQTQIDEIRRQAELAENKAVKADRLGYVAIIISFIGLLLEFIANYAEIVTFFRSI